MLVRHSAGVQLMQRARAIRFSLTASLLAVIIAIVGPSWRADAQPGGMRMERVWFCSKCGGSLGNGVNPPSTCWRCNAKLRPPANNDWFQGPRPAESRPHPQGAASDEGWSVGHFLAVLVGIGVVVGAGFYVMNDWS